MKILLSGSSGFIGSALKNSLSAAGHQCFALVRREPRPDAPEVFWNPAQGILNSESLEGFSAVIHLAGENLFSRWTSAKKSRIRNSRIAGTCLLCQQLANTRERPQVLLSASAVGFYGSRGDEVLTEAHSSGGGFLAEVCREWEAATEPAAANGIRVCHMRLAMVLNPEGGALGQLLLPFRLGLGAMVGSGNQFWSWISLADVAGAVQHLLQNSSASGPVNFAAPDPVRNREFTASLKRALNRPAFLPMPELAVRLVLGEMGEEMLLSSARMAPAKLLEWGYSFRQPNLDMALEEMLH